VGQTRAVKITTVIAEGLMSLDGISWFCKKEEI
jgi:hypothetical protein